MLVSAAVAAWCLFFLLRSYGPAGFLGPFALLTLVGGGIGHIAMTADVPPELRAAPVAAG